MANLTVSTAIDSFLQASDMGSARTIIGMGTGDSPSFTNIDISGGLVKVSGTTRLTFTGAIITTPTNSGLHLGGGLRAGQLAINEVAYSGTVIPILNIGSTQMIGFAANPNGYDAPDLGLRRNAAGVLEVNSATSNTYRDLRVRSVIQQPPSTISPSLNGDLVVEATSNTTLTFKLKGTDGTVRTGTITLS